jgi:hypothetical protein
MASPRLSIDVQYHRRPSGRAYLKLTTWGLRNGSFGSLGVFRVDCDERLTMDNVDDLAALVLTALYGLDYDL